MASASAQPRTRLHVGGLPRELLDDELRARFAPFGEVRSVEVLREKPESPFFRREDEGSVGSSDSESASDGVGRGGRGGRGGKAGRGVRAKARAPTRPPPCRGFAYVDLRPTDAKSLNRCVTLYNGCAWRGGVLSVRAARPRFLERLAMERDGVDEHGNSLKSTKASRGDLRVGADDADATGDGDFAPTTRVGDELEIDGRARREKTIVLFGKGSKSHKRGASSFPTTPDTETKNTEALWRMFEPSASYKTLRRLGQLPESERAARAIAKAEEARFEKRRARMFARLGKDTTDTDTNEAQETVGSGLDRVSDDDANDDANDDAANDEDDRFALPRAFFSSAVAAERAAARADARRERDGADGELAGAGSVRERFGLGPVGNERDTEPERKRRRQNDSVEMRALAAFLGASDDEDADDDAGGGALATAAEASPRLQTTKPLEKPSAAAGRSETVTGRASASAARPPPRDPDEGGVPMARTGAKWWEAGSGGGDDGDVSRSERDARAPTRNKPTPTASDVEKEPIGLARDFFRAAAPFAPSGTRIASTRVDASAASGAEFPGAGASDDDGDDSVSEEALLRDWRGEDDASVSASSHSQGFSESESGEGSGGSESESGEPGVVDFD